MYIYYFYILLFFCYKKKKKKKKINTFELKNSVKTIEELYDGVVFSEILNDM